MAVTALAVPPIVWWKLDKVLDARTIRIRSDTDEVCTITLGYVGDATNEENAVAFIQTRLKNRRLQFWALSTSQTNWMSRPMCLFIDDVPEDHRGMRELVHHFPMLNEELIAKGYVEFQDVPMPYDEHGLKARLRRAYEFRKDAEQAEYTVPAKAAPSASSTVR